MSAQGHIGSDHVEADTKASQEAKTWHNEDTQL